MSELNSVPLVARQLNIIAKNPITYAAIGLIVLAMLFLALFWIKNINASEASDSEKSVEELENLTDSLLVQNTNLNRELKELKDAYTIEMTSLNEILKKVINKLKLENREVYKILEFIDPEGWEVYHVSEKLLKIDVYKEFVVEDTLGWFEKSDGYDLKHFAEIAAFGECEYKRIGSMHEVLESYTIDYKSSTYRMYENQLYEVVNHKLIDKLCGKDLSTKIQFLKKHI